MKFSNYNVIIDGTKENVGLLLANTLTGALFNIDEEERNIIEAHDVLKLNTNQSDLLPENYTIPNASCLMI